MTTEIVRSPKTPSVIGGAMIIAGTAVGAGMFSLPTVSSGMWFSWALLCLVFTWFCMFHSGLMILEANLNYPVGASFDTFVKDLLGVGWNIASGLSVAFVHYILTYAYISGGGSIVIHTLESTIGAAPPPAIATLLFAFVLAFIVWLSTKAVSRIATILIGGMVISFIISVGDLTFSVKASILFNTLEQNPSYLPFLFAALPFFLTSFGFHGNVPSLMKYYGKNPIIIRKCLLYGSLLSLGVFIVWQVCTMGNVPRADFQQIVADGGNIGVLVAAVNHTVDSERISALLNMFANLAVISSFLGVALALFDYIADRFNFDDTVLGRTKTAMVTFVPPTLGGLFFPDGFLYAIGFAGLAATVFAAFVPALMVRASRKRFGSPHYQVWGGNALVLLIFLFGLLYAACHILAMLGLLPIYGR